MLSDAYVMKGVTSAWRKSPDPGGVKVSSTTTCNVKINLLCQEQ